jgi:DNA-binding NarL/FixJ family response regulator
MQNGLKIVGEAENRAEAMSQLREKNPDLVLLDLTLGTENGIDLIKDMRAYNPNVNILVLSMHEEKYYSERVLHAGARGYVMKQEAGTKVIEAIRTVLAGKIWLSASARERMLEFMVGGSVPNSGNEWLASVNKLSNREFEIFSYIGKGYGTAEIANVLNLSVKTIDTHKEHIKMKLHCESSQDLRQYAIEWQTNKGK